MELVSEKDDKIVGRLSYSLVSDKLISIDSTFVDSNYRGEGIADKLMHDLVDIMNQNDYKCILVCSYAVTWFAKNKEYQYLIK